MHPAIQGEITELSAHAPVEKLVKIDVPIVTPNTHFKHNFLGLIVCCLGGQSKWHGQSLKELCELFFSQFDASVSLNSELNPRLHEDGKVLLVDHDWTILIHVVCFELCDDN